METTKLDYPVYTLDNRLLLPAGKLLTSEALDELIATNKGTSYQVLPLLVAINSSKASDVSCLPAGRSNRLSNV